ncbi:MAG: hypothetical protein IKG79_09720, partial [Neisseriaceae bacterium]|nr:hypothetical protein [Neisseriaceae bacterium]
IKAVDAYGPAFLAKYPEFATTVDTPMNDTVEYNIFVGGESLFNRKAAAAKVRGNVCLEKMPDDLASVPGFDPLPPESAIGPGAGEIIYIYTTVFKFFYSGCLKLILDRIILYNPI